MSGSRRGWLRGLGVTAAAGGIAGAVLAGLYHHHVVRVPGDHLAPEAVRSVVVQESPVYYADGVTRVGVFFEDEHRDYVAFEDLPVAWTAAVVAAEDASFWTHAGIDPKHVVRAVRDNLQAGGLVAGGSTLTQQTAKNLFYRPDRTLRSKLREALDALRLEHHYDKATILELYANQFHVTGNGRGLGIAARHFFDKSPDDLTVLECAFLAGLVKGPANYDPFLGDAERQARATANAEARTRYVLRRLTEVDTDALTGPIPDDPELAATWAARREAVEAARAEAARLLDAGFTLPFDRGTFRFDSSAVLDEVARRLAEPPFDEVFEAAGIDDPRTAGIQVVTTLDPVAQRAATYGLWHHLTEVGMQLEGLGAEAFLRPEDEAPRFDRHRPPVPWTFRAGRVAEVIAPEDGRRSLRVDLGGHDCHVDRDALVRAAVTVARAASQDPTSKVSTAGVEAFVDGLPVDRVVWVSVRSVEEDGTATCDLEVRPELQGASVVVDDGRVLAMVGGNDNRNFNRATALRQVGSVWKTVVLHAALELGWSPTDRLDNRRAVFPFSTTFYYPRPDHVSTDEVSLAWAGAKSENLATVWLLYHLVDGLSTERLAELAAAFDLARREGESEDDYRLRIQRAGVLPTPARVQEALYLDARREVLASLPRSAHPDDAVALRSLLYGWGFEAEARRARPEHQALLEHAWTRLEPLHRACGPQHAALEAAFARGEVPADGALPDLWVREAPSPEGDAVDAALGQAARPVEVACGAPGPGEGWIRPHALDAPGATPPGADAPDDAPGDETWTAEQRRWLGGLFGRRKPPTPEDPPVRRRAVPFEDAWVGGRLHGATLDALASALERRRLARDLAGDEAPGLYDPAILYHHQDFRVLLALRYVAGVADRYGVRSEVQEVLSLPLGASEITLEESATLYEGLIDGEMWTFPGEVRGAVARRDVPSPPSSALLIAELRDAEGAVLYRALPAAEPGTAPVVGVLTRDVLGHVVDHGTGRRARGAVSLGGAPLPLVGKTGTTNDFRNAAFVGALPRVDGDRLDDGPILAVYVGYDDNREMRRGRLRLDGSRGALPAWVTTARGLAAGGVLGEATSAPSGGWAWTTPRDLVEVPVDPSDGRPTDAPSDTTVLTRAQPEVLVEVHRPIDANGRRPRRAAPRTEDVERWLQRRQEAWKTVPRVDVWVRPEPRDDG